MNASRLRIALTSLASVSALAAQLCLTTAARAERATCDEACWRAAVGAYVANPRQGRQQLLALESSATDGLPPAILLLLADAHLRGGQRRTAAHLFERVASDDTPEPLRSWALLGGSWLALRSGNTDRAMTLLEQTDSEVSFEPAVVFLRGFLEAAREDPAGAARLEALANESNATQDIRDAARLALGLTSYWAGRTAQARQEFDRLANAPEAGVLEDEARYAAARVVLAEGRRAEAMARLEQLVASAGSDVPSGSFSTPMLDLDKQAILHQGFLGYRRTPLEVPAAQMVRLLDWNGFALAKAMLARLARQDQAQVETPLGALEPIEAGASTSEALVVVGAANDATLPQQAMNASDPRPPHAGESVAAQHSGGGLGVAPVVIAVVLVFALACALMRREARGRAL